MKLTPYIMNWFELKNELEFMKESFNIQPLWYIK